MATVDAMSTPQHPASPAQSAPARFAARAVDLGAVKEAAEARARARKEAESGSPVALSAPVTVESFEQDVVVRSTQVAVVVQLGSPRAPGSDDMAGEFAAEAQKQQDTSGPVEWVFRYVDVDTTPEIAQAFGVQAVPTVLALAAGRPLTSFEGVQPVAQLTQFIDAVVGATAGKLEGLPAAGGDADGDAADTDPRFDAAADALDRGDHLAAVGLYDEIIADPGTGADEVSEAKAARATAVLLGRSADGEADEIDRMLLEGRRREAFDVLISRLRETSGEGRDAVRDRLLELFSLYDQSDPEVMDARTRMASSLF